MILPENSGKELPFALFMGPQRAGTSWIDRYMRARGDVCLPRGVKEVFFFDRHYGRGADFYAEHFTPMPQHRCMMEVSTTVFDLPEGAQRVYETFGRAVTLLCPLRHPVARSYSLYLHYKRYGLVSGSLREACAQNPQILTSSDYAVHLARWFDIFGRDAVHILFQEELDQSMDVFVRRLCGILDLPYAGVPRSSAGVYNEARRAPVPVLAKVAQRSADYLRARQLYFVINAAKAAGLKPLVFGGRRQDLVSPMSEDDFKGCQMCCLARWSERKRLSALCRRLCGIRVGCRFQRQHELLRALRRGCRLIMRVYLCLKLAAFRFVGQN